MRSDYSPFYAEQTLENTNLATQRGSRGSGAQWEMRRAATVMEGKVFDPEFNHILLEFLHVRRNERDFSLRETKHRLIKRLST